MKPRRLLTIDGDSRENALLLVRLGHEDAGRVDPARILPRRADSPSRLAFLNAQDHGWLDGDGWVTETGRAALARWAAEDA
jgi:hypothetical protein